MTDYGIDLDFTDDDLDELGRSTSGATLLGQALWRRITTPRGALIDDPEYGIDVRGMLSQATTPAEFASLPSRIRAALLDDPRLALVEVTITQPTAGAWLIKIRATPDDGPTFDLVGEISAVSATLLEQSE